MSLTSECLPQDALDENTQSDTKQHNHGYLLMKTDEQRNA